MSGSSSSPPAAGRRLLDEPLGLTVHSLPVPQEVVASDARRTVRGRWKMLALLLVCAAPIIASYLTYYVIRPEARRNFGELIEPQRSLPALTARALDGSAVPLQSLRGQWLLVSVAGGACDSACEKHLYFQRQLRTGLGKDRDRLDWVWLVSDNQPVRPEVLSVVQQQATVLRIEPQALGAWLAPAPGRALPEHLYLVDPIGNWMMRFPPDLDAEGAARVKRDLERLMRAAAFWDTPGRPAQ
jgi:hypothetical protein